METLEVIFLIFLFIVIYTYIGYGILIYFLVIIKKHIMPQPNNDDHNFMPEVALLIAAYNEEDIIQEKMDNIQSLRYPKEKLKVFWITDGSTDRTNDILKQFKDVIVLFIPERKGKTSAINRAMEFITNPIVVFTDANTMLNIDAIMEIVNPFNNPNVGCVAGEKRIAFSQFDNASSGGEGIYWKYESKLKELDSELYSAVGAAGELYAIRRELFVEMDNSILLDDFFMSMKIASKGYKIHYCAKSYAVETGSLNIKEEKKRKIRIAAGGLQSVYLLRDLLNVFKYPILSFQYISHRVLRWTITPFLLFSLIPLNIYLLVKNSNSLVYLCFLIIQILFYLLSFFGFMLEDKKLSKKIFFIPYYFLFMNLNVFFGIKYLLDRRNKVGTWEKSLRKMH